MRGGNDVTLEWMHRLCASDGWTIREFLKRPFTVEIDGIKYAGATNETALVLIEADAPPFALAEDDFAAGVRRVQSDAISRLESEGMDIDFQSLKAWAGNPECPPKQEDCQECNGTGKIKCKKCSGRGYFMCECLDCGDVHDADCDNCKGSGRVDCPVCHPEPSVFWRGRPGHVGALKTPSGNYVYVNKVLLARYIDAFSDARARIAVRPGADESIVISGAGWLVIVMPVRPGSSIAGVVNKVKAEAWEMEAS